MLTLSGKVIPLIPEEPSEGRARHVYRLSTNSALPPALRPSRAFLAKNREPNLPEGFAHYFRLSPTGNVTAPGPVTGLGSEFDYLDNDDIIAVGRGHFRSLFRANSRHNSLLLTERCNNYCLMCSQPPKRVDDSWILDEAFEAIRLMPRHTPSLGLTGGEPTLYGARFIELVRHIKHWLPATSLHILSNGRAFSDRSFASQYAGVEHPDAMVGIPVYAADPARHDYVVQARGAYDETIRGILNLKEAGQKVEIRVVLHKQTVTTLKQLAEFIARNLLFVDHVALMGLEMTGFTRANLDALWIDPAAYRNEVRDAVQILAAARIPTSLYNQPLCLIHPEVESHYTKSISDWKNEFPNECGGCGRRQECGGFFSSALRHGYSQSLKPF